MPQHPQLTRLRRALMVCAAGLALIAPTACTAAYGAASESDDQVTIERANTARDTERGNDEDNDRSGRSDQESRDESRSRNTSASNPGAKSQRQTADDDDEADDQRRNRSSSASSGRSNSRGQSTDQQQDSDDDSNEGLQILGKDCSASDFPPHTGFQEGRRCVSTAFGEVGAAAKNPTLLIVDAPERVSPNQPFTITVSTRNLVRDRFLPAAQGGYYLESSFLNEQGIQRGHFHTACRMLESTRVAPNAAPEPAFFLATEDGGGGAAPDRVEVEVTGLPERGIAQCAVWAGDGSHRTPMMERANQIPAFDSVRIEVR